MGQPAAKKGDKITAIDTHIVMVPSLSGSVPTPLPHPFTGILKDNLSSNVNIMGKPAATVGSTADNTPPHTPTSPGTSFQTPPSNKATIASGSQTVKINGKSAARHGDIASTCNDPSEDIWKLGCNPYQIKLSGFLPKIGENLTGQSFQGSFQISSQTCK